MYGSSTPINHRHVVAIPYPGRGHINPMLNLTNILLSSSPNLLITFIVTEEWLGFLQSEPQSEPPPSNFRYATLPQLIPSELVRAADFHGFYEATATKLVEPFERVVDELEPPPSVIVYDTYLPWVVGVANPRNIAVASVYTMSASVFSVIYHFDLLAQHGHFPIDVSERGSEIVDYIPGLPAMAIEDLPTFFNGEGRKVLSRVREAITTATKAHYLLFTSIYEIEQQVLDCLKSKLPVKIHHIGPLIPYSNSQQSTDCGYVHNSRANESYFQWLDAQPKDSVLYISQGSFLSVSSAQMDEIVAGIKQSGVRYLWVTRGDSSRFKDGPSEMGLLVPWCDQLKVLCHPSVGGFWTHCGWNSTSEGIYAGVPMLTCPIFWDQVTNSKLIVSNWKIGTKVLMSKDLVTRHQIAQLVKKFMDSESEERNEMVTRVKSLSDVVRKALGDGGSASSDLNAFIKSIST